MHVASTADVVPQPWQPKHGIWSDLPNAAGGVWSDLSDEPNPPDASVPFETLEGTSVEVC